MVTITKQKIKLSKNAICKKIAHPVKSSLTSYWEWLGIGRYHPGSGVEGEVGGRGESAHVRHRGTGEQVISCNMYISSLSLE